jgi:sulfite reductase alpha subunit-like flavoprotein
VAFAGAVTGLARPAASLLFFGCRNELGDYYYREELGDFVQHGVLLPVVTAFSRDQAKKVYVSQRIRENAQLVWKMLQEVSESVGMTMGQ